MSHVQFQSPCTVERTFFVFRLVDEECFPYEATDKKCTIKKKGRLLEAGCSAPPYKDRKNRYTVSPAYRLGNETDIMYEITRSGPVQGTLLYFSLFLDMTLRGKN